MQRFIKFIVILIVLLCIGTASAEEQTGSITVYLKNVEGTITVYRADTYTEEDPDELAAFMNTHNIQGITKSIAADTPTAFADLPKGEYLVVHENNAFRPFLVTIPVTVNGSSTFAAEARPKTQDPQSPQTGDPTDPFLLCAVIFGALMGIVCMAGILLNMKKSAIGGKMFVKRVQNEQKRRH